MVKQQTGRKEGLQKIKPSRVMIKDGGENFAKISARYNAAISLLTFTNTDRVKIFLVNLWTPCIGS